MTYQQTLDYMYARLPMFQRIGPAAYKADLHNIIALCEFLGNPQQKLKCIHVAGTNGKGSTSSMLAAVLQSAGYKTGLFTSPHLHDFKERIKVNGIEIEQEQVTDFVAQVKPFIEEHNPSFFEITVGMAFLHFAEQNVDIAVIETGLGGRLDSTNIITPLLSIITNIGWDHQNLLGDTLEKIASEKAGIIKPHTPIVIGQTQPELELVFRNKASQGQSPIYFADQYFALENLEVAEQQQGLQFQVIRQGKLYFENVLLQLSGLYQQHNVKSIFMAFELLNKAGLSIPESALRNGLANVVDLTGLKGRWQVLGQNPLTIADTGHNKDGLLEVLDHIGKLRFNHLHFVLGVVNDKELTKVFEVLPRTQVTYYFCKPNIPRGLDAQLLYQQATLAGLQGIPYNSVAQALAAAKKAANTNDLVFVGGSTFTVAEVV